MRLIGKSETSAKRLCGILVAAEVAAERRVNKCFLACNMRLKLEKRVQCAALELELEYQVLV